MYAPIYPVFFCNLLQTLIQTDVFSVIGTCDGHETQNGLTGFFSFSKFLSDPVFSSFWASFSSLFNKKCFSRCHKLVVLEYRRCQTASVNQLSFTKYFLDISTTEQLNISQMFMFFYFLKKPVHEPNFRIEN